MSKPKSTYDSAVLRLAREERAAALDPAAQARSHEAAFLRHMSQAREDFDWIVANEAWVQLGHATFADWWDARVTPIAASLGMRPTREIAKVVIERVVEDQKDLPKAQQRSQRDIAAMVGVSQKSVSRSLTESNDSTADLGEAAADPVDAMHAALEDIDAHLAGQAGQRTNDPTSEEGGPVVPVASSSAPSVVPGVASDGAQAEQEEPSASSPPADERPQGDTGASSPAAAPQLVNTPVGPMPAEFAERLDRLVPDPNPNRAWQDRFLDSVFAAAKAMRGYSGAEIAEKADAQLRAEFARFVGDMESLLHETSKAQIDAADNVVRLRRVQ